MKRLLFPALILALGLLISCQHLHHSSKGKEVVAEKSGGSEGGTGESFDEAVIITNKRSSEAVTEEYAWLKEHYPGYSLVKQTLEYNNEKPFDVFVIKTAAGEKKTVYFDIAASYGKF